MSSATSRAATGPVHDVLVVGAGFAGLGTAVQLRAAGVEDVVILERAGDIGGTWRDNTYPGAACDVPSLLYSYSFARNPDWSRTYSGSAEILGYIHDLVDRHDLRRLVRFDTEVTGLEWDGGAGTWTARTAGGGAVTARAAVLAAGPLANPSLPDLPGLDTYAGTKIHSARWDHSYAVTGARVGVIGTGASAVQIIPELVRAGARVTVFQRTAGWVVPRLEHRRSALSKALFRHVPLLQDVARDAWYWAHELFALGIVWPSAMTTAIETVARGYLRLTVSDPWQRRQLTPDFRAGCKRMLVSSEYYPALQQDSCTLVTWPIATLSPAGVRTADGVEHELDAIVFATGFDVPKDRAPFPVRGPGGRTLADAWGAGRRPTAASAWPGSPTCSSPSARTPDRATTLHWCTWRPRSRTSWRASG